MRNSFRKEKAAPLKVAIRVAARRSRKGSAAADGLLLGAAASDRVQDPPKNAESALPPSMLQRG